MIVYFHGLNTYGDDDLHVGPLKFGLMHSRVEAALRGYGIEIISITGLGHGSAEELSARAQDEMRDLGLDRQKGLTLVGQSIGGLIARVVAANKAFQVRQILTFGTPHHGAVPAELGVDFPNRYPRLSQLVARFGYDAAQKASTYENFTSSALKRFNERYPGRKNLREVSLLCELPREEVCEFYRLFYDRLHPEVEGQRPKSDGFILSESQKHGEIVGPFALDHYSQMGFHFHLSPALRRRSEQEFSRLMATVASFVSK